MRKGRGRLVLIVATLLALSAGAAGVRAWRLDLAYREAKADLDARRFGPALEKLDAIEVAWPPWRVGDAGEFSFHLGYARWIANRRGEAVEALRRVPASSPFATRADVLLAEDEIAGGRWREAEERLDRALARGGPGLTDVRAGLDRLYRLQVRFDDAAAILRDGWKDSPDPVRTLRDLWTTERGTPPYESLGKAIEAAAALAPDDDRVRLARARLATQTGRLDEADTWLSQCESARPDEAVRRARIDWALAADRPDRLGAALRALGKERLSTAEDLGWRAWFARRRGDSTAEREALRALIEIEPRNPAWLDRAAALAAAAGDAAEAAGLRARKADVDRAIAAYTREMSSPRDLATAADRSRIGGLAEAAGRPFDARAWYRLALDADPDDPSARRGLDGLAALDSRPLPGRLSSPPPWESPAAAPAAHPPGTSLASIRFVDRARESGLVHVFENGETAIRQMPVALGGGVGLLDYDGDGHLDVYAVQGGTFPPEAAADAPGDRLFRNRGDGTFDDATDDAGLPARSAGYGHGVAVGDVDGDGRPDLLVTRWRAYALYLNRGGRFDDVTDAWGLGGDRDWPTSAAFADLDGDGDLDLYVCHYVVWDEVDPRLCRDGSTGRFMSCSPTTCASRPDRLYRNDGDRFVDVSESSGVTAADVDGRGLGVVAADFDDDGLIDLFVANDKSANFLFRNLGGMKFEEVAHAAGVAGNATGGYQAGMGVVAADLDGDGRLDVAVTNYYGESTSFYRNLGDWLFTDQTAASGIGAASRLRLGFGIVAIDADNDGLPDLLTANGHTDDLGDTPYRMPAQLLRNVGNGRFVDATAVPGGSLEVPRLGRALAVGDLDDDGRLDALLADQNAPLALFRNETAETGRWISFRLEGRESNRDAIGAVVTVVAGGRRQVLHRTGGGSYLAASDPRIHVGLGPATTAASVEVRWPSGRVDKHRDLPADRVYHLVEGAEPASDGPRPRRVEGPAGRANETPGDDR